MCNDNSKISQEIPCWASNLTALFYPLNHQLLSKKTFWTCFKTFEQESFLNSKKAVWLCQQPPGLLWAACELELGRVRLCAALWTAATRLLCPQDSPGRNPGVGCHSSPGGFPDPGIESMSPALQVDFLTPEPLGKPTGSPLLGTSI